MSSLTTPQWIAVGTGAALGAAFIGYCIYFDQKRRSDPDFRKKLKERTYCNFLNLFIE
jgi:hypothetical protein